MRKVLVANRGEIAVRVLRACREMGITGVAVYSEADREALHVQLADEAYSIGETAAAGSYLNIGRIVQTALRAGADAVHPGYGFLSENAAFAQAVVDAGLTWVGPSPETIAVMGDKRAAREAAVRAGAPVVAGTTDAVDAATATAFGAEHGYPLALKAAFGGGGRGMKVVTQAEEIGEALAAAEREARAAFGRSEVYVERYLVSPRHIEAQILADNSGEVIFLGERDCSLQRRHQKLLEESPAPQLPETVRRALGDAACAVARAANYRNAGTVEFLYEPRTMQFFFLEMNTRLQVEHPVTELVRGVDLVQAQLRIAAGEHVVSGLAGRVARGHAIEARINAEDPDAGFLPRPGKITTWREPGGPGVRVDTGVRSGYTVPQAYDSLLAKLIVWGEDREQARMRMLRALSEFVVEGVPTTIPFHQRTLQHRDFIAGNVSTQFVEHDMRPSPTTPRRSTKAPAGRGVAALAEETPPLPPRTVVVEVEGKRLSVAIYPPEQVKAPPRSRTPRSARAVRRARADSGGPGQELVTAPMQGTVVKVLVNVGAPVQAGQTLVVLEAMKMENHIAAHRSGIVAQLPVKEGQSVATGATVAVIAEAAPPS